MKKSILLLEGDGIGPEITTQAIKVLRVLNEKAKIEFEINKSLIGGVAIDRTGEPLPPETINQLKKNDAVLLASIGGDKWDSLPNEKRPEKGLLELRKKLGAFANLRPVKLFNALIDASPLKKEIITGIDLLVIRELTGGIYFGSPRGALKSEGQRTFVNTLSYTEEEIKRIAICAGEQALLRSKRICSVDKANVLEVSKFWRELVEETIRKNFPEIELSHLYVDNAAMQLIKDPRQFDVILTSNLFGDILSDESAMLTGSIGMLPSASLGKSLNPGLFEPVHGSAPDIAGQDKANPIAMILSVGMMLKISFKRSDLSLKIEKAVNNFLSKKYRTEDLIFGERREFEVVGTEKAGDLICKELEKLF